MLEILDVWIENKWDNRRWELALKSDKPIENYQEMVRTARDEKNSVSIDDLSEEEKNWLRNTG